MHTTAPREASIALRDWFSKRQVKRRLPAVWTLILASLFGCASDKPPKQSIAEPPPSHDLSNGPTLYGKVNAGVTFFSGPGSGH
jgi:hypothetical protein